MTDNSRRSANIANARKSTGPSDTSQTRLNAVKHGILSSQVISANENEHERSLFESMRDELFESLGPQGELEELLVDELATISWRRRRVIRFETAALSTGAFVPLSDWGRAQADGTFPLGAIPSVQINPNSNDPAREVWRYDQALNSLLQQGRSFESIAESWSIVFEFVESEYNIEVDSVLTTTRRPWRQSETLDAKADQIARAVEEAARHEQPLDKKDLARRRAWKQPPEGARRPSKEVLPRDFWTKLESYIRERREQLAQQLDVARASEATAVMRSSLPNDRVLDKVQRYEAHLSRLFYRTLHELERLQAIRLSLANRNSTPDSSI